VSLGRKATGSNHHIAFLRRFGRYASVVLTNCHTGMWRHG
jgi:hypothetical protein